MHDTRLVSPDLVVAGELTLALVHRYEFEADDNVLWDGGVLKLSVDDGPWEDVSAWVDPGYDGVLTDEAGNPLALREAFTGTSPSWPAPDLLVLDFGDALVGHTVNLSLRIGTNPAGTGFGWELTLLETSGLSNLPFPAEVDNVAHAGTQFADADGDGFGDRGRTVTLCSDEPGYVDDDTDCDDGLEVNPAAVEVCDGLDDDCDGTVDVGAADAATWHADADGDGFTDPAASTTACAPPPGYAAATAPVDCDDGDDGVHPGAEDLAGDGIDQDCSGADAALPDGDDDGGRGGEEDRGGCGCGTGAAPSGLGLLGALALARRRRRLRG